MDEHSFYHGCRQGLHQQREYDFSSHIRGMTKVLWVCSFRMSSSKRHTRIADKRSSHNSKMQMVSTQPNGVTRSRFYQSLVRFEVDNSFCSLSSPYAIRGSEFLSLPDHFTVRKHSTVSCTVRSEQQSVCNKR